MKEQNKTLTALKANIETIKKEIKMTKKELLKTLQFKSSKQAPYFDARLLKQIGKLEQELFSMVLIRFTMSKDSYTTEADTVESAILLYRKKRKSRALIDRPKEGSYSVDGGSRWIKI